jgi:hypothetical protein
MIDVCPYKRPDERTVTSLEGLLYFVWEREAIRIAKEGGWPVDSLTNDPVLKKYKFTNIRRENDRVSKWIIEHLIQPNEQDRNLWLTLLIARLINWPPTLQALLDMNVIPCAPNPLHKGRVFNAEEFSRVVESLKEDGGKVYSGAYMTFPGKQGYANKSEFLAHAVIGDVVKNAESIYDSLWECGPPSVARFVEALSQCFGLSTFMAGQVAADLSYAEGHLDDAEDLFTYAPIGPGSSRGLNYLKNRRPFASWGQADFNKALIEVREAIEDKLDIQDMTLHDVQNVMCEFSKYCRCVLNEGVPKTIYKPEELF